MRHYGRSLPAGPLVSLESRTHQERMRGANKMNAISKWAVALTLLSGAVYAQRPPDVAVSDAYKNTAMETGALISLAPNCGPNPPATSEIRRQGTTRCTQPQAAAPSPPSAPRHSIPTPLRHPRRVMQAAASTPPPDLRRYIPTRPAATTPPSRPSRSG